jgi:hypothetical protein
MTMKNMLTISPDNVHGTPKGTGEDGRRGGPEAVDVGRVRCWCVTALRVPTATDCTDTTRPSPGQAFTMDKLWIAQGRACNVNSDNDIGGVVVTPRNTESVGRGSLGGSSGALSGGSWAWSRWLIWSG